MFFILNSLVILSSSLLFILVFLKNHHSKANKAFLGFIVTIVIWIIISSLEVLYNQSEFALLLVRSDFAFGCLIALTFFLFVNYFQSQVRSLGKSYVISITSLTLLFFCLSFSNFLIRSVTPIPKGLETQSGTLFLPYSLAISFLAFYSIFLLFQKMRKSSGHQKAQILFVLIGLVGLIVIVLATNLILPKVIDPTVSDYGVFGFIFFIGFTSYAIVKYRFMDIRLVITRSIVFAFLVSFVTGSFASVTYISSLYFSDQSNSSNILLLVFSSLIIVVLIDPLKKFLGRITNKIFFKASIDYPTVTKQLTNIINDEIELDQLVKRFSAAMEDDLRLDYTTILLPVGDNAFIEPDELAHINDGSTAKHKRMSRSIADTVLIKELSVNNGILILDELDRRVADEQDDKQRNRLEKIRTELENTGSYAIVPISDERGLEAIIMLSRKLSGEAFSNDDVQLFQVIAPQMASGIQKARLYQEAKEFGVKLQREVEKATSDLREANTKLKELDVAKSEFMSIASHQLRTPLTGIMGYLSMINGGDYGPMTKEQAPVVKDILEATRRLIRMVNIFLNVTRIEAGRFILNYTKVPFHDVIEDMYKELKPTADAKHVKLVYNKTELPVAEVDKDKIKDVVLNLIDNAIKYSPQGSVNVSAESDGKIVHVMVKDTGVGIAPVEAKNLFSKFVRGSGIARVEPNGSGLGLFIAKKIVEEHGGRIWVESEGEGKGSTFQFEIPLKADKEAIKKVEAMKARVRRAAK